MSIIVWTFKLVKAGAALSYGKLEERAESDHLRPYSLALYYIYA